MPFKSVAQASACYKKNSPKWNCNEWASKTKWCKIPNRARESPHRNGGNCVGKKCLVKIGPRGGRYIECKDGHKVYLPKNAKL